MAARLYGAELARAEAQAKLGEWCACLPVAAPSLPLLPLALLLAAASA